MMETAKIRRSGYPIRHSYKEFVERYRYLAPGIGPAHKVDCREAAKKICNYCLKTNKDFQFGTTKIFLKDQHDVYLEEERDRVYLKYILILQRGFRRVIFKRWLKKHRDAAITIQKCFRGAGYRKNYIIMRDGFRRLQAVTQSRHLVHRFTVIRRSITLLQARCRGVLVRRNIKGKMSEKSRRMHEIRMLRSREEQELRHAGNAHWREIAEENYTKRVAALAREMQLEKEVAHKPLTNGHQIYIEEDNKVVDDVFGFLPEPMSPEPQPKQQKTAVSNLLLFFEKQTRRRKKVPKKLLSRPVTQYGQEANYDSYNQYNRFSRL